MRGRNNRGVRGGRIRRERLRLAFPLTLSFMEQCYQTCCFGNAEPTHIIMSVARREELRNLIAVGPYAPSEWLIANGRLGYMNAVVIGLPELPDKYMWMANVARTDRPELTQRFCISHSP